MRILTWNVNSIRVRLERLLGVLERHEPDVCCLREIKVEEAEFPALEVKAAGYTSAVFGQRSYNGVAILVDARIDREERKGERPSDHAPVVVDFS